LFFQQILSQEKNILSDDDFESKIEQARTLYQKSKFTEAIQFAQNLHGVAISQDNKKYEYRTATLLSKYYLALDYYQGVEAMLLESLKKQNETGDNQGLIETYYVLGMYYLAKKNLDKAILYLHTGLNILNEEPNEDFKARTYLYLGVISEQKNEIENAEKYYKDAEKLFGEIENDFYKYYTRSKISSVLLKQDLLDEAYELINESIKFAEYSDYPMIKSLGYKRLSQYFEKKNQFQQSNFYLKKYQEINDEILFSNQFALFPIGQKDESNNYKDQEIQVLRTESKKDGKTLRILYLVTFMSVSSVIILIFLTRTLYRNNTMRVRNNELLRIKNQQLEISKNKAEASAKVRERFISTISHELRTPLYAVTGLTHLLLKEEPKPEQIENLESLKYSGEYLLALVNDILEINRLDSERATLEFERFNLRDNIQQTSQSLNELVSKNNNKLILEIDPNLPDYLLGDEVKIHQVIFNLVGNAIKFTENGKVWIRVKINSLKANSVNFIFEVEDTGIGIPKEKLEDIFDNFSQGSLEISKKFGGTGLGLAIVKRLLKLMDSDIAVESEVGKGSKFFFELTMKVAQEEVTAEDLKFDLELLKNKKVLIVEDNKINQMITRKMVENIGMKCEVVDNGTKAVELVKNQKYDGVLMDIRMPGISGIEATRYIRIFNPQIPIIALTALFLSETRQEIFACGMDDLISKPFKPDEFYRKLFKLLV
jgi:signal transduction histidine kinase/CheY-like chemotaxis protein